jgi:hypothetical protein
MFFKKQMFYFFNPVFHFYFLAVISSGSIRIIIAERWLEFKQYVTRFQSLMGSFSKTVDYGIVFGYK